MKKFWLFFVIMLLIPYAAEAVKVQSLYQAELPVSSQAADVKEQAVREGFLQVLTKLTGDPESDKNPMLKPIIKKADYFVQEYSYSLPTPQSSEYIIQIHYNVDDLNRWLKRAGIAYWGENRPLILVWLAYSNKQKDTEIIGTETPGDILKIVKQEGKRYGLPLLFPMLDVFEMNQVSTSDVTSMSLPVLKQAAERYSPDAILIGNIEDNNNRIDSKWELLLDTNQWNWAINDKTVVGVVSSIMNEASQALAKHFIVKTANVPQFWLRLQVTGVMRHNDLARLTKYLKDLSLVQQVQLDQVSGDIVELSVLIQGSVTSFMQNAAIGKHLVLKSQETQQNKLSYEWVH